MRPSHGLDLGNARVLGYTHDLVLCEEEDTCMSCKEEDT